jgi:hypothetical protein
MQCKPTQANIKDNGSPRSNNVDVTCLPQAQQCWGSPPLNGHQESIGQHAQARLVNVLAGQELGDPHGQHELIVGTNLHAWNSHGHHCHMPYAVAPAAAQQEHYNQS